MEKPVPLKLYSLVLYNLSPIQQWIQSRHAGVELWLKYAQWESEIYWDIRVTQKSLDYNERAKNHKTVIVLNGWTSSSLLSHVEELERRGVIHATFEEPDLWGITTAVAFIAEDGSDICKYFTSLFKLA